MVRIDFCSFKVWLWTVFVLYLSVFCLSVFFPKKKNVACILIGCGCYDGISIATEVELNGAFTFSLRSGFVSVGPRR